MIHFYHISLILLLSLSLQKNSLRSPEYPIHSKPKASFVKDSINPEDIAGIPGFPNIGKWMFQNNKQRANWLDVPYKNKILIEPINVIFIDSISKTTQESEKHLIANLKKAGYKSRSLHSSGYFGYIENQFCSQLPKEKNHAFSNASAFVNNNHCRIFGPHSYNGVYYYIASVSRENIAPFAKIKHHFASFTRARDEFSHSLNKKSNYKIKESILLQNAITNSPFESTGDHDGYGIVLVLHK